MHNVGGKANALWGPEKWKFNLSHGAALYAYVPQRAPRKHELNGSRTTSLTAPRSMGSQDKTRSLAAPKHHSVKLSPTEHNRGKSDCPALTIHPSTQVHEN